jgi:hypothetical protein
MKERNFTVYFELFGKKMQTKVIAKTEEEAKQVVQSKIIFHKVMLSPKDEFNEAMNIADDILGILGGKKS